MQSPMTFHRAGLKKLLAFGSIVSAQGCITHIEPLSALQEFLRFMFCKGEMSSLSAKLHQLIHVDSAVQSKFDPQVWLGASLNVLFPACSEGRQAGRQPTRQLSVSSWGICSSLSCRSRRKTFQDSGCSSQVPAHVVTRNPCYQRARRKEDLLLTFTQHINSHYKSLSESEHSLSKRANGP